MCVCVCACACVRVCIYVFSRDLVNWKLLGMIHIFVVICRCHLSLAGVWMHATHSFYCLLLPPLLFFPFRLHFSILLTGFFLFICNDFQSAFFLWNLGLHLKTTLKVYIKNLRLLLPHQCHFILCNIGPICGIELTKYFTLWFWRYYSSLS